MTEFNYKKIKGFSDSNNLGFRDDGTLIYITEKKNWCQVLKHGLPVNLLYNENQNIDIIDILNIQKIKDVIKDVIENIIENIIEVEDVIEEEDDEEEDLNTDESDDLMLFKSKKKKRSKTVVSSEKQKNKTIRSRVQKIIRPKELKPVCFEDNKCGCRECNLNILEEKKKYYEKYKELYTCFSCEKFTFGLQLNQCITTINTFQNIVFNDCIVLCDDCFYVKCCKKHFFYPNEKCKECFCGCCGDKNENLSECIYRDSTIYLCRNCESVECCINCGEFCGSEFCRDCRD